MVAAVGKTPKPANGTKMNKDEAADDFEAQIATLKAELEKVKAQLASSGERSYAAAKKAAASGVEQVRTQGEAALADIRASATDMEAQLSASVREKPMTALAIAAGVGYFLALLTRR